MVKRTETMVDKADRDNRTRLAIELSRLCPEIPPNQIARDVEALGRLGARLKAHEERKASYESYYNSHIDADGEDKTGPKIEAKAAAIAKKYGATVQSGDPRGYVLHLHKAGLRGNTMGGDESGFGIN